MCKLKALAFFILFVFQMGFTVSHACKKAMNEDKTYIDPFIKADYVFLAQIIRTELIPARKAKESDIDTIKAKYKVLEVFKGKPSKSGVLEEMIWGVGNCTLGMMTGMEYIIYMNKGDTGFIGDSLIVISPVSHDLSGEYYENELKRVRGLKGDKQKI